MSEQLALGYSDRHEGQAAALAAATAGHRDYRHRLETALAEFVAARAPFTADDLRAAAGNPDSDRPNLLPSVIGVAAAQRVIVPAGEYRSCRRERRASRNRVWIGCPQEGNAA
ncbi:hypothetical protein AB0L13_40315 [Saccharopolyspora shandongensis]|uniref:hypothetical protein n=1 Tax=Saccharopolyspora shandongensis TaxID=418495 RepID=UPI0034463720